GGLALRHDVLVARVDRAAHEDHARPAAVGLVVDALVLVGRERPEVVEVHLEQTLLARDPDLTVREERLEHLREERQHIDAHDADPPRRRGPERPGGSSRRPSWPRAAPSCSWAWTTPRPSWPCGPAPPRAWPASPRGAGRARPSPRATWRASCPTWGRRRPARGGWPGPSASAARPGSASRRSGRA